IAARGLDEPHAAVATVEDADRARAERLRLQRHHTGTEPTEAADAIADVRADVVRQGAGRHEARIERIHRGIAGRVAVVDVERTAQWGERGSGAQVGESVAHRASRTQRDAGLRPGRLFRQPATPVSWSPFQIGNGMDAPDNNRARTRSFMAPLIS